jgi:hypothetical protein
MPTALKNKAQGCGWRTLAVSPFALPCKVKQPRRVGYAFSVNAR